MKLLTLEDYQKAGETFCQSIGMLPKELGEDAKTEDIIKVLESIGTVALRLKMEEKEDHLVSTNKIMRRYPKMPKVDYYKYGMSCHGLTVRCLPYGWAFLLWKV